MAEAMTKHFDFKSANFEDFCVEMDRFICAGDVKHYMMCFDCFDFNKDRFVCYQDTYNAIESRKENIYDSDLIKIKKMFELKKKGLLPAKRSESRKGRKQSIQSLSSSDSSPEEGENKKLPTNTLEKPEALSFDDFLRIKFKKKPQLLQNFFFYTCNFDIENNREVLTPVVKSRRQSEEIIFQSKVDNGVLCLPEDDPKSNYYFELDLSMGLFHIAQTEELLKKFEFLRDKSSPDFKTISIPSMIENWPKLLGAKCDYVSERFYYYFAGPQNFDVTKARFLNMIFEAQQTEMTQKMFSFAIYDARSDSKITPDEIYSMEKNLPNESPIHNECMVIANEFIASIFGRKRKPVPFIEFAYFNELVPDSCFYKEFLRIVRTPLEELLTTKNSLFECK
jgi:Ca2+-binding EF-hand superfamily protein